jgi:hypothetical protein
MPYVWYKYRIAFVANALLSLITHTVTRIMLTELIQLLYQALRHHKRTQGLDCNNTPTRS